MVVKFRFFIILFFVLMLPLSALADDEYEQSFWESMYWGTEADPGVLRSIWNWIIDIFNAAIDPLIQMFYNALPSGITTTDFTELKYYFEVANDWLPLDYAFSLLAAYYIFVSIFASVKIVVKLIPTIG